MAITTDRKWGKKADAAMARRAAANGPEFKPPTDARSIERLTRTAPRWAWVVIDNLLMDDGFHYTSAVMQAFVAVRTKKPVAYDKPVATSDSIYDQYADGEITRTQAKVALLRFGYGLDTIESNLGLIDASASGELG